MLDRDIISERLFLDLVGPDSIDEVLDSRPSDVYLTGILWPNGTAMGAEEDDRLGVGSISDADGIDALGSGEEEVVSFSRVSRPCTAGLSFAVKSSKGQPNLSVNINFALYEPIIDDCEKTQFIKDRSLSPVRELWRRHEYKIDVHNLVVCESASSKIILTEKDVPPGIWLHMRVAPWEDNWLVTLTIVNEIEPDSNLGRDGIESITMFQVKLEVFPESGSSLIARPSGKLNVANELDNDDSSTTLLYRNAFEYAVGHTCSAEWELGPESQFASVVRTTWIPKTIVSATNPEGHKIFDNVRNNDVVQPLSAKWLSEANNKELGNALSLIPDTYSEWIDLQEKKIPMLSNNFVGQAHSNLSRCRRVEERMREGVNCIEDNPVIAESFKLANQAMLLQHSWDPEKGHNPLVWRPFQLGFILLSITSIVDRKHPDRNIMDLLWFPTGGGKTEAYLALIAFLAFYRRLSSQNPDNGAGVAAIMRYTLRLLTTQQFVRASAMILACEAIRRVNIGADGNCERFGNIPFSIGLWVGGEATPNRFDDAKQSLNGSRDQPSPKQLAFCPACNKSLNWYSIDSERTINVRCENKECVLYNSNIPLPVFTVDEDLYREHPTLLIGTIDKFAQIVRHSEVNDLFNISNGYPPELIIQDELHLVSGPLGTIAGLYEVAIDRMFTYKGQHPKIIGSTATIRRAEEQVKSLFNHDTCQFPPPGIDWDDSGFAVIDKNAPGRLYIGITTAGRSAKFTLQAVSASLLQSAHGCLKEDIYRDPYWTLVSYFNSLRELGGAVVLMQDDVNDSISTLARRHNETERSAENIEELTSHRTQLEVRNMLDKLAYKAGQPDVLDVVLATNMLSVGIDIPRLGLMLVNGQPKGISEYIQATSRVGRGNVPGLIAVVLNNAKARDRSHYESFATWHSTLYRDVEATSVTPFASRSRDKALHAVLVALVRHLVPNMLNYPAINHETYNAAINLIDYITRRAEAIDPEETAVRNELIALLNSWERREPRSYWNNYRPRTSLLQDAEKAATQRALGRMSGDAWPTLNNMRSVEPSTPFKLIERLREFNSEGGNDAQ